MAPREVKAEDCPSEYTPLGEIFKKVGNKFTALYEMDELGQYGQDYTWQVKSGALTKFTAKSQLAAMLKKAKLTPGELVTITFIEEIPPKTADYSPKRVFNVKVDPSTVKTFKTAIVAEESAPPDEPASDDTEDAAW